MEPNDKLKLAPAKENNRRVSIASINEFGSDSENARKIKYGGPLAGSFLKSQRFNFLIHRKSTVSSCVGTFFGFY
jgi:hypothetical protein